MREFADQLRMLTLKDEIPRATAAGREAISTISIPDWTKAFISAMAYNTAVQRKKTKRGRVIIEPRIGGYEASGKSLHYLAIFIGKT